MTQGFLRVTVIALFVAVPLAPRAQVSDIPTLNYAFATQLGSGIYSSSGGTVQLYRVGFTFGLIPTENRSWGLRLELPLTFGFYNFDLTDILDARLPDNVGTLTVIPTFHFDVPLRENWFIAPFAGAGVGRDFEAGDLNYIYAVGINHLYTWPWKDPYNVDISNRLVYSGYTNDELSFVDDFAVLETLAALRRPLGLDIAEHELEGAVFAANYLYFISPRIFTFEEQPIDMGKESGANRLSVPPYSALQGLISSI